MWRRQIKPGIEKVNLCSAKQVARWFCQGNVDEVYLAFIQLVKDEEQRIVPLVLEKTGNGM